MHSDYKSSTLNSRREKLIADIAQFASGGDPLCLESKYNLFITAHFGKSNQIDAEHNCKHFRNIIDRKILRSRKRLFKILSLEQGSDAYNDIHAHWLFELPTHISQNCFEALFAEIWKKYCGSDNITFKQIDNRLGGVQGLINYCTKESIFGNVGTFIEHCSDNSRRQSKRQSLLKLKAGDKLNILELSGITSNAEQSAKHLIHL